MTEFYCYQCQGIVKETGTTRKDVQVKHAIIMHGSTHPDTDEMITICLLKEDLKRIQKQFWDGRL